MTNHDYAQLAALGAVLKPQGGWIQTRSGVAFYPLAPVVVDIHLDDIAHALGNLCRYGGHSRTFYSVAEHSVLLSYAVPEDLKRWALLHDASEAFLIDVPSPIKPFLSGYKEIEARLMHAVAARFGLTWPEPDALRDYDRRIVSNERAALHGPAPQPWTDHGEPLPGITITGWMPLQASARFLMRARELGVIEQ
jgi:uncharacterized protein